MTDGASTTDENSHELQLLVGYSAGQIQIFDPTSRDLSRIKVFNEERIIDRTKVSV